MRKSSARPRRSLNCRGASYLLAAALCAASPAARAANGGEPYPVGRTTAPVAAIVAISRLHARAQFGRIHGEKSKKP